MTKNETSDEEVVVDQNHIDFPAMMLIRDVVQQAIKTGYLSVAAEEQLRNLLQTKYELEDFDAFMTLQEAARLGKIRQESRELRLCEQQVQ